ncbi:hypothetical protein C8T65DRAFT_650397 [Cerioporus squamosus]|nr:hypothetical protein C8T65DRAFT_650397 [Cerioporus squamosus]
MQKLPVGDQLQIFRLACTDGDYTGRSLSQTSRAVRAASQPARFHSIALSIRVSRLESFITLHQKLCVLDDGTRAELIHLHLDDKDEDDVDPNADDSEAQSYAQVVKLLHLVADDLVSLVLPSILMMPSPTRSVQLTDRPFPSLRSLIVNVPSDKGTSALATPVVAILFPALTHMHIVMSSHSSARAPFSAWNTHGPGVTHLRISFCPLIGINLKDIRCLLGTLPHLHWMGGHPGPVNPPPAMRAWPSVRHIAIQPVPPGPKPTCRPMGPLYRDLRSELSWTVEEANREGIFESARVLDARPSGLKRSSKEWHAAVRDAWDMVVTSGVDSDWLTLGEEDEAKEK